MKSIHFILLVLLVPVVLLGSLFQERGERKQINIKKDKQIKNYNFPVLKINAKKNNRTLKAKNTSSVNTNRLLKIVNEPIKTSNLRKKHNTTKKPILLRDTPKMTSSTTSKRDKILHKKIKSTRKTRKSTHSFQIPILSSIIQPNISLQDIPILNKILPKPSKKSRARIKKKHPRITYPSRQRTQNTTIPTINNHTETNRPRTFSGGTSRTNLDMAKMRIEADDYQTNIILDSYYWVGYNAIPIDASPVSGTYFFKYEPFNNRIVGNLKGYNTFSALLKKQDEMLTNNPVIKSIYIDRYIGDDGIKFIIELKKKVKVNIFDLENPSSIIIELYPIR